MPESLEPYDQKRDFETTPEPVAKKPRRRKRSGAPVFVIHRHDARNLHYDLRLEMEGVLKSWAVPKGFSHDPKEKHFAVQTEDHPIEYEDFHGLIPSGNYGAGPMTIWDKGSFRLVNDADGPQGIADGKLEIIFDGGRLRGEWHMVKLANEKSGWLLFKGKDRYARGENEPAFAIDIHTTKRSAFPRKRTFMQPQREHRGVLSETDWVYEPSLDGVRVFAEKKEDTIKLRAAKGKDVTKYAGRVVSELKRLRAHSALIDGVLVCSDETGLPNAKLTEAVLSGKANGEPTFYVFDLLYFDEWSLHEFPVTERKAALFSLLSDRMHLQFVEHERMNPAALLEAVHNMGMNGAVAKRVDSSYQHATSDDWVQVQYSEEDEPTSANRNAATSSRVKFTNRSRVLWPQAGITKGELIDYCDCVADTILPYLANRPLSLNRFPNGIHGKSFFQKGAPAHTPDWVRTQKMDSANEEGHVNFIICDERDTLLYLANSAAIELHPWHSQCDTPDTPDWAILDLDPYGADFTAVIQIANTLGEILHDAGLEPLVKTSGSKGLHIYVPVLPEYTYDQVRMFCEGVARLAVIRHPDIATVERQRSKRVGQVYIDFMQNRRGQTIAAPYSVRPIEGACVSTPLLWEELTDDVRPAMFTIYTVLERIEKYGDMFADAVDKPVSLLPAIDAIRDMLTKS